MPPKKLQVTFNNTYRDVLIGAPFFDDNHIIVTNKMPLFFKIRYKFLDAPDDWQGVIWIIVKNET